MIPENKKAAVNNALQLTFGSSEFEDIQELTAGLSSAMVFKIRVSGKPYLLRIITRTDAMSDPTLEYTCMKVAAEAGIAPGVLCADIEERISIIDFIEAKPFPVDDAKLKMPDLLKRLHSLPPFSFRINYLDKIDEFVQKFQTVKIIPEEMANALFPHYAKIRSIYPHDEHDMVACHNDLKPENTLFDGDRVWLVDWEAAFLNDRYLDLAIVANFVIRKDSDEKDYLEAYFGKEVTEYQYARFFLMRQMLHFSYFVIFILFGKPDEPVDFNTPKPNFREFHDLIWAGKLSLASMDNRVKYALVHMEQLQHNLKLKRFEDSLAIVANHQSL